MRWLMAILLLFGAAQARAQTVIPVPGEGDYRHERTGVTFDYELAGMIRRRMMDFGSALMDVAGTYASEDEQVLVTVYLYRAGLADVSVNYDLALHSIELREGYAPGNAAALARHAFAPPGHDERDSFRVAYEVANGGPFRTGGLALIPQGEWLLKVRASSNQHDPEDLAALMERVVEEMELPAPRAAAGPALAVLPCATSLRTGRARVTEPDFQAVIPYSLAMQPITTGANADDETTALPRPTWCRDATHGELLVYRPDDRRDAYVIALGDSGSVLEVGGHDFLSTLLEGKSSLTSAIHANAERSVLVALLDDLPAPEHVLSLLDGAQPLMVSDRAGQISILVAPDGPPGDGV